MPDHYTRCAVSGCSAFFACADPVPEPWVLVQHGVDGHWVCGWDCVRRFAARQMLGLPGAVLGAR